MDFNQFVFIILNNIYDTRTLQPNYNLHSTTLDNENPDHYYIKTDYLEAIKNTITAHTL